MSELPKGWEIKKLSEIASTGLISDGDWVESKDQDPTGTIRLIQLADIGDGNFKDKSSRFMNEEKAALLKCTFLQTGDVLIARMPDPLGRACIFPELGNDCVTVVDICIVRLTPDDLMENRLLKYWLNSPAIRNLVDMQATGTTRRRITKKKLAAFELPVPPRAEQKRIADKLDSVLAKVEAAQARLDKIPAILKRFRQSVLAAATSGELTKDWREDRDKKNWLEYTLNDIADIRDPHPSHRTPKIVEGGVPYIGIGDISNKGVINFENARKVSEEVLKEHNKRYQLNEGDFVFGKIGTLGRATKLPIGIDYTLSANVILIQPKSENVVPEYLMLFLSSPSTMDEIANQANSTSQSAFGIKKMRAFSTRLPSLAEQKEIVSQINRFFEHANTVEKQYDAAKARLDKLTQSILAKAFKGELLTSSVGSDIEAIENSVEKLNA